MQGTTPDFIVFHSKLSLSLSLSFSLSPQVTVPEEKIKELAPKELNSSSLYFLAASMANLGKKSKWLLCKSCYTMCSHFLMKILLSSWIIQEFVDYVLLTDVVLSNVLSLPLLNLVDQNVVSVDRLVTAVNEEELPIRY